MRQQMNLRTHGEGVDFKRTFDVTYGAFFWGYSSYSYPGLGITECTEFQFLKERGFQIWKRNIHGGGGLRTTSDMSERPRRISRQKFPKERVFCVFRVNRISSILFILLLGAEWTEWYSVHSENGIAPKRTQIPFIPSIPIPE